jgi:hypothetical protein
MHRQIDRYTHTHTHTHTHTNTHTIIHHTRAHRTCACGHLLSHTHRFINIGTHSSIFIYIHKWTHWTPTQYRTSIMSSESEEERRTSDEESLSDSTRHHNQSVASRSSSPDTSESADQPRWPFQTFLFGVSHTNSLPQLHVNTKLC